MITPGCSTTKYLAPVFLTFSASPNYCMNKIAQKLAESKA